MAGQPKLKQRMTIFGVGVNDADYVVQTNEYVYGDGKRKQKLKWVCPYYSRWSDMMRRCYSSKFQERNPAYKDCIVSEEWKYFSNFRKWMVEQDWEGMQLEKDLLVRGNKIYSAETCVFVTRQVNIFLIERGEYRGRWPIGVNWSKTASKFVVQCGNPFSGKQEYLGYFTCPYKAHAVWLAKKLEHAYALAAVQSDPRVAIALIERYESYVQH